MRGEIEETRSKEKVQNCDIYLNGATIKYVYWKERKKDDAAMRLSYTALNESDAETALENLRCDYGKKSYGLIAARDRAWDQSLARIRLRHPEGLLHD